MAEIITMPRLSDTMEEGTVASWLKKVGDKVSEGDILAEIETDKATMEFESFYEGTLLHIGIAEGETAEVDKLLAIIGEEGEDISSLLKQGDAPKADAPVEREANERRPSLGDNKACPYWLHISKPSIQLTKPKPGKTVSVPRFAAFFILRRHRGPSKD